MQWFAYILWIALGLCFVAAILSYFYCSFIKPRRDARQADTAVVEGANDGSVAVLNEHRWQIVLAQTPYTENEVPTGTQQRLVWAVDLFGVQRGWLCGEEMPMYPCLSFHNAVGDSIDFIGKQLKNRSSLRLYVVKPEGIELDECVYEASVVLCFAAPVKYAQKTAWRYWPINVFWEWGYLPEQMQCCQILYVALMAGCDVVGVEADFNDIYDLLEGKRIPKVLQNSAVDASSVSQWNPTVFAHAGKTVTGQCDSTLSDRQLKERIQQAGWK
ncbi:MAG: hypothetical protein U9R29_01825 [Thermodesulfobacteriota bacterium]|nr:hypothetical protein [Thermodesulfobacteriota bacterium]